MAKAATIIMPTFDHGATIEVAARCVLNQTEPNIELFIIGDGVSELSRKIIHALSISDSRIRFFDHPKHLRRGEPYRHEALQEARGDIVCYMCDRDIWLPQHVEMMRELLGNAEFTHSLSLHVLPGDKLRFFPVDLSLPAYRQQILEVRNLVAFSCAAHTLDMYHRLPFGWRTTPQGIGTDWYMFQQFLEHPDCRAVSGTYPSAITFPSPPRLEWSVEQRLDELHRWTDKVADKAGQTEWIVDTLQQAIRASDQESARLLEKLHGIKSTSWWQLVRAADRVPGLTRLYRTTNRVIRSVRRP